MNIKICEKINNAIIVGPIEFREYFLLEKENNPFFNFSYITKENLAKTLFGDYNEQAIKRLMELKNINFDIARKNLEYVSLGSKDKDDLQVLYDEKLIYIDEYELKKYSQKKIVFLNYVNNDPQIINILSYINPISVDYISINDLFLEKNNNAILEISSSDQEVRYILNYICNEIYEKKMKMSDFVIVTNNDKYDFLLKMYSKEFNLLLNFNDSKTLFDSFSAKILLDHLSEDLNLYIENNIDLFTCDQDNLQKIRYLYNFYNIKNINSPEINFRSILKNEKSKNEKIINGINVTSNLSFMSDKHYVLIGALDEFIPKILINNDLLDDEIKKAIGLTPSDIENIYEYNISLNFLKWKNCELITYPSESGSNSPAFILLNNDFNVVKAPVSLIQFSENISKLYFYDYLNRYKFFNDVKEEFKYLINNFNEDRYYDNSFTGINKSIPHPNEHSSSSINTYIKCPFSYYLQYILKISEFEDTTKTKFGKYAHKIFEHVYDKDFDFNKIKEAIRKNFEFNDKELILLDNFEKELNLISKKIIEQNELSKFSSTFSEKYIKIQKENFAIGGYIDRLSIYDGNIVIIDYKTGDFDKLDNFKKYGIGIQLPTYLYLIQNNEEFKNDNIIGVFIQPICRNGFINHYQDELNTKLKGVFTVDYDAYIKFDCSIISEDKSKYVEKASSLDKHRVFEGTKKLGLFKEDFIELATKCDEYFNNYNKEISNNVYPISPYIIGKETSCKYCSYSDICYRKNKDYRILDEKTEGEEENGND